MGSSQLKYYIHDSIEACRLQLIGEFTATDVKELEGCWNTAKTTLGERQLIVDVAEVDSIDDPGRKWIAFMVAEGAQLIEKEESKKPTGRPGMFRRALYCVVGTPAHSPTQAQ